MGAGRIPSRANSGRAGILDFGPSGAATVSRPLSAPWSSRCSPVDCYFLFLPRLEQGPMSSAILGPAARSRTALAGKPGNLRLHCLVACAGKPGNLRFHRLVACAGKPGNLRTSDKKGGEPAWLAKECVLKQIFIDHI